MDGPLDPTQDSEDALPEKPNSHSEAQQYIHEDCEDPVKQTPQEQVQPFASWAACRLMGKDLHEEACRNACSVPCQLKEICGLYLQSDIQKLQQAVSQSGLTDMIIDFLTDHYRMSTTLHGLSLQMSRAFAHDATSANLPPLDELVDFGDYMQEYGGVHGGSCSSLGSSAVIRFELSPFRTHLGTQTSRPGKLTSMADVAQTLVASRSSGSRQLLSTAGAWLRNAPSKDSESMILAGRFTRAGSRSKVLNNMASRTVVLYLMQLGQLSTHSETYEQELEALMTEYLSRHWHTLDEVKEANAADLKFSFEPTRRSPGPSSTSLSSMSRSLEQPSSGGVAEEPSHASGTAGDSGAGWLESQGLIHAGEAEGSASASNPAGMRSRGSVGSIVSNNSGHSSWANVPMSSATRARRNWQRAMQAFVKHQVCTSLSAKREFRTMAQLLQELSKPRQQDPNRRPVFLFLGGGMAAGKSSVRSETARAEFWSQVGTDAVVIEADAIKDSDIVLQELRNSGLFEHDASLSQFVHEYSTRRAQGALVAAVNEQRDVIFDGTCSWKPFVEQTVAMVRDHDHDYLLGPGYHVHDDGSTTEQYWCRMDPRDQAHPDTNLEQSDTPPQPRRRLPYKVELVGVTCSPTLAVARGFWRRLRTGRGVPVAAQLRSHKAFAGMPRQRLCPMYMYAQILQKLELVWSDSVACPLFTLGSEHWSYYCQIMDSATLYHTGSDLTTLMKDKTQRPKVIAHVSSATRGALLVEPQAFAEFHQQINVNVDAGCDQELYPPGVRHSNDVMCLPCSKHKRISILRAAFAYAKDRQSKGQSTESSGLRRAHSAAIGVVQTQSR